MTEPNRHSMNQQSNVLDRESERRPSGRRLVGRYRVVRPLGAGAMGEVFEVVDEYLGARMALKALHRVDADTIRHFKREFRASANLFHPNLVRLGELFEAEGRWYFTMELVPGKDLLTFLLPGIAWREAFTATSEAYPEDSPESIEDQRRPAWLKGVEWAQVRETFAQVASGLVTLHGAGKVHRDVKPTNIVVRDDGTAVVLDFGLARDMRDATRSGGRFVGTPLYMAPEQVESAAVGPAADWFAFGVMLYQVLTGQPPHDGSLVEMLAAKLQRRPEPPREVNPAAPADLCELCIGLLERSADARPEGREVLRALGRPMDEEQETNHALARACQGLFVGRREELDKLRAWGQQVCRERRPLAVVVQGPSGVGKSALVRQFLDSELDGGDALTFEGRCYEREMVPYKGFDGVIDSLARHLAGLTRQEQEALAPPEPEYLVSAFPALRRAKAFSRVVEVAWNGDPHEHRSRVLTDLKQLLRNLAQRWRLTIALDDIQWTDADTLAVLRHLTVDDGPAMLLVCTQRTSKGAPVEGMAPARSLKLGPMTESDSVRLASSMLGSAARGRERSDGATVMLAREAGGHPLFLRELVRYTLLHPAREDGHVELDVALRERVGRLDGVEREVLQVTCLAGGLTPTVISDALGMRGAEVERILAGLGSRHLVRAAPQRGWRAMEPYHDRVREVVVGDLGSDERRQLHRRVAEALEAVETMDAEMLVEHWVGAGEKRQAARCAKLAAERAMAALAFDRAAQMLRDVLVFGDLSSSERSEVQERLGDALGQAGRGVESADAYLAALSEAEPGRALDLERRAGEQFLRAGRYERGLATLRHVLSRLDMSVARTWWAALFSIVRNQVAYWLVRFVRHSRPMDPVLVRGAFDAMWSVSVTALLIDPIGSAALHSRSRLLAVSSGDPSLVVRSETMETLARLASPRTRWSSSYESELDALELRVARDPYLSALLLYARTVSSHFVGEYTKALEHVQSATAALVQCGRGVGYEASSLNLSRMWFLFYLGEYAELSARAQSAAHHAAEFGDRYTEDVMTTGWPGFAWLVSDEPRQLREQAMRATKRGQVGFRDYISYWRSMSILHSAVYEDRVGVADQPSSQLNSTIRPWLPGNPPMVMLEFWFLKGTVSLASAMQRASGASGYLRQTARLARKIASLPVGRVRHIAHLLDAAIAVRRGNQVLAERLLRSACDELGEVAGYRAAAQWRLGKLLGGEQGATLVAQASSFFERQHVRNPRRLVRVLAPGFPEDVADE